MATRAILDRCEYETEERWPRWSWWRRCWWLANAVPHHQVEEEEDDDACPRREPAGNVDLRAAAA
jgi:hypothetical protein